MAIYEIYRNKAGQQVYLDGPSAYFSYVVKVSSAEYPVPTVIPGEPTSTGTTISVPFKYTKIDGTVDVELSFVEEEEEHTVKHQLTVITPVFTWDEFSPEDRASMPNLTESNIKELERFIRHIIEAYTGQSFGYAYRTYDSTSRGAQFNVPLVLFTGLSNRFVTNSVTTTDSVPYDVVDDGFGMVFDWDNYHVKSDTFWLTRTKGCPSSYTVTGYFGYVTVPQDVKEAARVLMSLFNCPQTLWRDRYIESIRNADGSSVKYNEGAYYGTGSVTADQLLAKYVRSGFSAAVV